MSRYDSASFIADIQLEERLKRRKAPLHQLSYDENKRKRDIDAMRKTARVKLRQAAEQFKDPESEQQHF